MQPKNQNDGVQFSERYWNYLFAKRHLGIGSGGEVFPIGKTDTKDTRIYGEDLSFCLDSCYHKGTNTLEKNRRQLIAAPVLTPDREKKRQNGRRMKDNGDPSFTLTAQDKHGIYNGAKIRRLTPTECCRLQGFPDTWVDGISDTQKYRCLGNAVTVNVIEAIMSKLIKE
ncbi:MAG: DNA cytosine methyltransferase [Nanoarchaeota archaeon]|nr:DNA cytosine methyltransferase [Nanoarchaeota archaeon]